MVAGSEGRGDQRVRNVRSDARDTCRLPLRGCRGRLFIAVVVLFVVFALAGRTCAELGLGLNPAKALDRNGM